MITFTFHLIYSPRSSGTIAEGKVRGKLRNTVWCLTRPWSFKQSLLKCFPHAPVSPNQNHRIVQPNSFMAYNVMYSARASIRLQAHTKCKPLLRCAYATTPYSGPAPYPSRVTEADVNGARAYCSRLVK